MNREILFRGYNYQYQKWFYGSLVTQNYDGNFLLSATKTTIVDDRLNQVVVDRGTIGQYTGLKDKNGNKIFEGDICKGNEYSGENQLFVIKYGKYATEDWNGKYACNTYQFGWYAEFIKTKVQVHLVSPNGIEIIGNIYDGDNK